MTEAINELTEKAVEAIDKNFAEIVSEI